MKCMLFHKKIISNSCRNFFTSVLVFILLKKIQNLTEFYKSSRSQLCHSYHTCRTRYWLLNSKITSVPDNYFCPNFRIESVFQSQEPTVICQGVLWLTNLTSWWFCSENISLLTNFTKPTLNWLEFSQCWVDRKLPAVYVTTVHYMVLKY
jgi:hypothetical protein